MKKGLICWDSSVLISYMRGDEEENRNRDMNSVVESIEKGFYKLVVSTLLYVEILESKMPGDSIKRFEKFMQNREKIEVVAVDIRVAKKAQVIRNSTKIKTPDAIHLATAIVSGAKLFHTFDKELLQLSGKGVVESIPITACYISGINRDLFNHSNNP